MKGGTKAMRKVAAEMLTFSKEQTAIAPLVSVDADGIITLHGKGEVWPYDREGTTAVHAHTPRGHIFITVKRHDKA